MCAFKAESPCTRFFSAEGVLFIHPAQNIPMKLSFDRLIWREGVYGCHITVPMLLTPHQLLKA
jgi:hypothetical protein